MLGACRAADCPRFSNISSALPVSRNVIRMDGNSFQVLPHWILRSLHGPLGGFCRDVERAALCLRLFLGFFVLLLASLCLLPFLCRLLSLLLLLLGLRILWLLISFLGRCSSAGFCFFLGFGSFGSSLLSRQVAPRLAFASSWASDPLGPPPLSLQAPQLAFVSSWASDPVAPLLLSRQVAPQLAFASSWASDPLALHLLSYQPQAIFRFFDLGLGPFLGFYLFFSSSDTSTA